MEAIELVQHDHVEGRGGRALLLIAAHVNIVVIVPPIGQSMNQPWIAVIGEDHRLVGGEQRVEIADRSGRAGVLSSAAASSGRPH